MFSSYEQLLIVIVEFGACELGEKYVETLKKSLTFNFLAIFVNSKLAPVKDTTDAFVPVRLFPSTNEKAR